MPPKKAPPKKKGEDERDFDAENYMLQKRIEVLQLHIAGADRETHEAAEASSALERQNAALDAAAVKEEERRATMTMEMRRQHAEMEESFTERIKDLRKEVAQAEAEIAAVEKERNAVKKTKDAELKAKELEIAALSLKIDTMGFEFADMMRVLLEKISERVEVTHTSSDASRPPLLGRMADLAPL
jgi:hypothetical protein